ncbi:hypothetical protein M569_02450 [Genlisea aurea]|uniref:Uncharacterized protein n=1 Tax=Genlisea aurea TaxID=192259 RepID=S8E8U0_9LAMI|nr:hypothetical protein M569_02450 [Genlisea aurea]
MSDTAKHHRHRRRQSQSFFVLPEDLSNPFPENVSVAAPTSVAVVESLDLTPERISSVGVHLPPHPPTKNAAVEMPISDGSAKA